MFALSHRWCSEDGKKYSSDIDGVAPGVPKEGWHISSAWHTVSTTTDPDGWQYSTIIDSPYWYPAQESATCECPLYCLYCPITLMTLFVDSRCGETSHVASGDSSWICSSRSCERSGGSETHVKCRQRYLCWSSRHGEWTEETHVHQDVDLLTKVDVCACFLTIDVM